MPATIKTSSIMCEKTLLFNPELCAAVHVASKLLAVSDTVYAVAAMHQT
jgi:hypothetical protein